MIGQSSRSRYHPERMGLIGMAMKNSPPQVIRQVDYLAPSNDEGGLASMINHLLSDTLNCLKPDQTK